MSVFAPLVLWLSALMPTAESAAPPTSGSTPWGEQIVVTATRHEDRLDTVPARVDVLDEGALVLRVGATLDDRLRDVPGFGLLRRVGSRAAHPTTQGVSLRGLGASGASRTLVALDGVVVNDPFGGWVAWSRLPSASLAQVELVHGGAVDAWGSGALGGVVQLLTRRPDARSLRLDAEGGTRDEAQVGVATGWRSPRTSALLEARGFTSDGHPVVREDQRGAIDESARSRHGAAYLRLDHDPSDRVTLRLRGNGFRERRGNGTPLTRNRTRGGYLALGVAGLRGADSQWQLDAVGQRLRFANVFSAQAMDRTSERPALDQFDVGSEAVRVGARWSRVLRDGRHRLSASTDLGWVDAATNEDFFYSGERFLRRRRAGGTQRAAALYLQDAVRLGARAHLQASIRADRWEARDGQRREQNLVDGSTTRDDRFDDRRRTAVSPRLGIRFALGARASGYVAGYGAFRAPTINELYRPFRVRNDITAANADLEPERLRGGELGGQWRGRRVSLRLAGYWNEIDNPVASVTLGGGPGVVGPCGFVPGGGACRQRRNLDASRVRGVEIDASVSLGAGWRLHAAYANIDARFRDRATPSLDGNRLPQTPRHRGTVAVERIGSNDVNGRLALRYLGERFEDDRNARALADHVVVDLTLHHPLRDGVDLYLRAENLLDETIEAGQAANGLVTIGAPRLVRLGVRWGWRGR